MEQQDLETVNVSSIKIIKIFLASSSELKDDRQQFEILINRKNKGYIRKGLFLELVMWEDFLDAMSQTRLQDEYNKAISQCDLFVSLFYTKVGKYTAEEFEKAFATFKKNQKPLIYTFFKEFPILPSQAKQLQSVFDFQDKLRQLGHFHTIYNDINHLKYLFDQQLDKIILELDNIPNIPAETLPDSDVSQENKISVVNKVEPPPELILKDFTFPVITVNDRGQEIKREQNKANYFTEELGNGVTLDMVAIPGGKFLMGTDNREIARLVKKFNADVFNREKPQHEVTVPSFFMGKYLVTQGQWQAVTALPKVKQDLEADPANFKGGNRPVERVSWNDAIEFCQRLSIKTGKEYRLPWEAEWEYACRGGTTTSFYFGEAITTNLANYDPSIKYANEPTGTYREETTTIGNFPPNAFGLYDMHGLLWEWCEDDWHENYGGAPIECRAWYSGNNGTKVVRGGSWDFNPHNCRSAYRGIEIHDNRFYTIGFRVVSLRAT